MELDRKLTVFLRKISENIIFSQGTGGNISIKHNDYLYVKSSGLPMSDFEKKDFFSKIKYKKIDYRKYSSKSLNKTVKTWIGKKPSIESTLHYAIESKYVFHLHELFSLSIFTHKKNLMDLNNKLPNLSVLEYSSPGIEVTKKILSEKAYLNKIIVLRNHGLIIHSDSLDEVEELCFEFSKKCSNYLSSKKTIELKNYKKNKDFNSSTIQKKLIKDIKIKWRSYPDHIVYFGVKPNTDINKISIYDYSFKKDFSKVFFSKKISNNQMQMFIFYLNFLNVTLNMKYLNGISYKESLNLISRPDEKYRIKKIR